jgi:hypothetical protein
MLVEQCACVSLQFIRISLLHGQPMAQSRTNSFQPYFLSLPFLSLSPYIFIFHYLYFLYTVFILLIFVLLINIFLNLIFLILYPPYIRQLSLTSLSFIFRIHVLDHPTDINTLALPCLALPCLALPCLALPNTDSFVFADSVATLLK